MAENTNGTGAPQAGSQETTPTPPAGQEQNSQNPTQPNSVQELPDWAQRELNSTRNEAQNLRKRIDEFEQKQRDAEADSMKKGGEFEALANQREARIKELEPQLQQWGDKYNRLTELALVQFKAEVKEWPASIKALLPSGETIDPLEWVDAVAKLRPVVEDWKKTTPAAPGNSPGAARPNPTGNPGKVTIEQIKEQQRRSGRYSTF
jgi:hypothetical protein